MAQTIHQKIRFRNTTTTELYQLYLHAKKHAEVTGSAVRISHREGAAFHAYDGWCHGRNLQLIPNRLIVQSWRAADWNGEDVDSTFILLLEQHGKDVLVFMSHVNIPDNQVQPLTRGWKAYYWEPWKNYLKSR